MNFWQSVMFYSFIQRLTDDEDGDKRKIKINDEDWKHT